MKIIATKCSSASVIKLQQMTNGRHVLCTATAMIGQATNRTIFTARCTSA